MRLSDGVYASSRFARMRAHLLAVIAKLLPSQGKLNQSLTLPATGTTINVIQAKPTVSCNITSENPCNWLDQYKPSCKKHMLTKN